MLSLRSALALVATLLAAAALSACDDSDDGAAGQPAQDLTRADQVQPVVDGALEPCSQRAWRKGGGFDYEASGITCSAVNRIILEGGFARAGKTAQYTRGLAFGDWICVQRALPKREAEEHGGAPITETICANGRSRFSFLFA